MKTLEEMRAISKAREQKNMEYQKSCSDKAEAQALEVERRLKE